MGQAAQLAEVADALRTTAGVYTSTGNDLDTTTLALTGVVQELLAGWQGISSTAFVNACNRAWNDEDKVSTSLSTTASALTALASIIEDNISTISSYETDSASTTIKPQELMAAQNASNMALEAIAGAVTQQAETVNAAAAQVGVCSVGTGGPWDENGLQLNADEAAGDPGQATGGSGEAKTPPAIARLLAKVAGPEMRLLAKLIDSLPKSLQKVVATLVGGAGNALPAALTSGLLSGPTLSTFITASLGSLVGSYVVDALALAVGTTSSATTITTLTIAGGVGMGTFTVYILKPLVLDNIIPQQQEPQPTVVVTSVPSPGEKMTTITRSDGSKEIIDSKPNGTSVITEKDSTGKVTSTHTVPTK